MDTSVWSLAYRRDGAVRTPETEALRLLLERGDLVVATGLVLQELLQGLAGPKFRKPIIERFDSVPLLSPDREDHVEAADIRNRCRRAGRQTGTVDALLAQLCIRYDLHMLSADKDFRYIAEHSELKLWSPG